MLGDGVVHGTVSGEVEEQQSAFVKWAYLKNLFVGGGF